MATKFCWFYCMGVAGRRRLVAQPGGITLGFDLNLILQLQALLSVPG